MTALMTVLAAGGGLSATAATHKIDRPALVIDASLARHGRDLVDDGLQGRTVRIPRTPGEARTDVRYLQATGYRVEARGPMASAALRSR